MLYVFYGNDIEKRTKSLERFLDKIKKDGFIVNLLDSNLDEGFLASSIDSVNLFGEKTAFVLRHTIDEESESSFVLDNISKMSKSDNLFIIVETDIKKSVLKDFESEKAEIEFFKTDKKDKERPAIFSLTDSFGNKDKKNAWIIFRKMRDDSISPDEIIPMLFWSIKNALLVYKQNQNNLSKDSTKLAPFVYGKASNMAKKFTDLELSSFLESLNDMYHNARSGKRDLDKDLELFILKALA